MRTVARKTKDLLFETRRRFHLYKGEMQKNISISLGLRQLFFSQTFDNNQRFVDAVLNPHEGVNAAIYVQNPQILIHQSGGRLTLDPSVCYRLDLSKYHLPKKRNQRVVIRKIMKGDVDGVNHIYRHYGMFPISQKSLENSQGLPSVTHFVAEVEGVIVGIVIGVNHMELFNSPERGSTLWGLAVLPGNKGRGIGKLLINYIVEHYQTKGIVYTDLYVDYRNSRAIQLYEKAGFRKISRYYLLPKSDLEKYEALKEQ